MNRRLFLSGLQANPIVRADSRGTQRSCEAHMGGASREIQRRGWQCPSTPPKVANTVASLQGRITARRVADGKADKEPTDASNRWVPTPTLQATIRNSARDSSQQGFQRQQGMPSYPRTNG
jgi:hypothetical protein